MSLALTYSLPWLHDAITLQGIVLTQAWCWSEDAHSF